ncbi:MAG: FAD-binding oxidoreductase [Microbacterium sp.]|uniref:FAD-binding oxidoreductase n=1 Tax=Microbacterium sp. TaxID=51671 RepID=UPI0039E449DB
MHANRPHTQGDIFVAGDPGYADAVATWDTSVSMRPSVVVTAASVDDIAATASWADARGLDIAVHNTGHGTFTDAVDAALIDVSRLRGVRADLENRTVAVQPGARWSDVSAVVAPHGLIGLAGGSPGVGVVGYTLGGGLSPIGRTFGMAADRVRAVTVLDADCGPLRVTAQTEPELFWALCGGGALGIVTELEFELVALPSLFGGGVYFPGEEAPALLTAYRDWVPSLDERTSTSIALLHLPALPQLPEALRGRYVTHLRVAHVDPRDPDIEATGRRLLAPMVAAGTVIDDDTRVMGPADLPDIHRDPVAPTATSYRGGHVDHIDDRTIATIAAAADAREHPAPTLIELRHLGGAYARTTRDPNSATARGSAFNLYVSAHWGPNGPDGARSLADDVAARIGSGGVGAQLNFFGPAPHPGDLLRLWPDADADRILAAHARLDPRGRLRTGRPLR